MTKALNDVIREIETVQAKIDGLKINAGEARAEAEKLDNVSHDALIADPAAAEQITTKVLAQQRLQQAYESKISEHQTEIQQLRLKALEVEAEQLEADADRLDKDADKHEAKTAKLLAALQDHEDMPYEPAPLSRDYSGNPISWAVPRNDQIRGEANGLRYSAALNRYYIATGTVAINLHDLRSKVDIGVDPDGRITDPNVLHGKATALLTRFSQSHDIDRVPA